MTVQNYITRLNNFDFDMIISSYGQSESPGNEQRGFFSSQAANNIGSRNYTGISLPALDRLIEKLAVATDRQNLVTHVHALDRLLQWSFLMVPHFFSPVDRLAYWNRFAMPDTNAASGPNLLTWWIDPDKDQNLVR